MQRLNHQLMTDNWWNAYSNNASPLVVMKALSKQGLRGETVMASILNDADFFEAGCKILKVFEDYLQRGFSDSILATMSVTNDAGVNVLHAMTYSRDIMMFRRWIDFLSNMLNVDVKNMDKNREVIYQMLNQQVSSYGEPDVKVKLLDLIPEQHTDSLDAYVILVNKLSHYGLAAEKVHALQADHQGAREKFERIDKKKGMVDHIREVFFGGAPARSPLRQFHLHTTPFVIPYRLDSREIPPITLNP
jgi:hypothetical protein